jgi:hypothetical protein
VLLRLDAVFRRYRNLQVRDLLQVWPCLVYLSTTTFRADKSRNAIVQEFVLPDFSRNRHGYIRQPDGPPVDGEQILYMGNERFSIPEVLFCPDHIGTYAPRETRCL